MNSRKIKFTLIALVVAFVMLVSATYAWFTLSTKPEISGIQTNIGANGSLEIALLTPQTFMHPEEIKASIGSSMVNQEVTYSNLFWGNVIDLSDESYGLGQISLLPSRLDISARNGEQTVVSGGLLTVPDYGLDGRFSYFNPHVVSASYDPPYFRYSADVSFHGVRGIGTISRVTVQQAALNNARTSIQSYESATRRSMESVWRANGDALFDILYRLHGLETQEFTSADVAVILDTCSRMLGVMDYLDAASRQGIVAVFAELIWDESQFLALKSMVENPANSLADLEDMLDAQAYLQYSYSQTLSQLIQYVPQDQQALRDIMQQCYALEGTVPDRNTIYNLLHTNLLSRDHTFINENNLFNFPSELVRDNTLTLAPTDIYSTNTGIMNHIQSYAGGYNVLFTYKDSYSISVDGNDYNQRSVLSSLSSELSLLSGSGMVNEDTALLDKTYGYAIDLAVRCNTDSDLLLQTVAADRVDPNATPDPDGLLSDTQGSGSYMRFNGSVFKDQMVPLMDAIRIGFLDNRNNLIAVAKLNTSNYTEEGNEITAPLYLYDYSVAQDGSLSMGERRKGNNAILSLPEDTATVLTVVVWLDGDHVPNSLVSIMGNSIDGTLNLQFASSAELNPAFKDDPDATKPDETKPVEPSDAYYLSTDNGQYAFYTLGADGSRNYTLPFSGTVDEENHTVIIDSISAYPEQGIWIPAQATGEDGAAYSVSIEPMGLFADITADAVHIAFVPIKDSQVGVIGTSLSDLFDTNDHSIYRTIDMRGLNTSGVTSMDELFHSCSALTKLNLSNFDTSKVRSMSYMFNGCSSLTELDLGSFDTTNVTGMKSMFFDCTSLTKLDLSGFNTANVIDMSAMFINCSSLTELDVSGFDTANVTSMEYMFSGCSSLTELDVRGFDTANVTSMEYMFSGCFGLRSLDVSGLDTSKVKRTNSMFSHCSGLTTLDVSGFDTANVTNMAAMFSHCSGLTTLDVSNFDTSKVTDMHSMFYMCSGLTELDVSNFDTSNVTHMGWMFAGCSSLTELDVSGFDTSNVTDMSLMFDGCSSLTELDVSNFDTSKVTEMDFMFYNCSGLTELDVSNFDTSKVTNMRLMFNRCSGLTELDVSNFDTSKVTDMEGMFCGCSSLTKLDISGFNTAKVTDMSQMFQGCSMLTELNITHFDTTNVVDMEYMFASCTGLTELDVSSFNTANVTTMYEMFFNCSGLTTLDVSNFDTFKVTNMSQMFRWCSGLTELDLSSFDMSKVTDTDYMLAACSDLQTIVTPKVISNVAMDLPASYLCAANGNIYTVIDSSVPTQATLQKTDGTDESTPSEPEEQAEFFLGKNGDASTSFKITGGDIDGYELQLSGNLDTVAKTLTITSVNYSPTNEVVIPARVTDSATGTVYSVSVNPARALLGRVDDTATSVSFVSVGGAKVVVTSPILSSLFNDPNSESNTSYKSIDLSGLDTSTVTDMSYLFYRCSSATEINVSGLDTSNVTDMSYMFYFCYDLATVDISGFDTSKVTNMCSMFWQCQSVTELDVSGFDTSSVTNMRMMFNHCCTVTELDVSNFDTSNVTDMSYMFNHCCTVTELDLNSFDTSNVTDISEMFDGCSSLKALDLSNFDTSKVTNMYEMFRDCSSLTELDLSPLNTTNVTDMSYMFRGCSGLTTLDISPLETGNVTAMDGMFQECSGLITLDLRALNTANVTSMTAMFRDCTNLKSVDFSGLNTAKVTTMWCMFFRCSSLEELDVSNINTSSVKNMGSMFYNCSSLTALDLSTWDMTNVVNKDYMFDGCPAEVKYD